MATIPCAPHMQVITCNPGKSMVDKLQKHTPEMETKLDLVSPDGTNVCLIGWSGENSYKAMLAAGVFQDSQRLWRRIKLDRKYDVVVDQTQKSFEASGKDIADTRAVLLVSGSPTAGSSPAVFYEAALKSEILGLIGQIFLSATPDPKTGAVLEGTGGVYLFESEAHRDAFLEGEGLANLKAEAQWDEVSFEKYAVATPASALGERNA